MTEMRIYSKDQEYYFTKVERALQKQTNLIADYCQ